MTGGSPQRPRGSPAPRTAPEDRTKETCCGNQAESAGKSQQRRGERREEMNHTDGRMDERTEEEDGLGRLRGCSTLKPGREPKPETRADSRPGAVWATEPTRNSYLQTHVQRKGLGCCMKRQTNEP